MKARIQKTEEVNITPKMMAIAFWEMNGVEQAEFFKNMVAIDPIDFDNQMWHMRSVCDALTLEVIKTIAGVK